MKITFWGPLGFVKWNHEPQAHSTAAPDRLPGTLVFAVAFEVVGEKFVNTRSGCRHLRIVDSPHRRQLGRST